MFLLKLKKTERYMQTKYINVANLVTSWVWIAIIYKKMKMKINKIDLKTKQNKQKVIECVSWVLIDTHIVNSLIIYK